MSENVRTSLVPFTLLGVLGLVAWLPAIGYSREWNQPTLPLAILAVLGLNLAAIGMVASADDRLRSLLRAALLYRLALTAGFIVVLFGFYGGGDAFLYHREGVVLAQQFWSFGDLPELLSTTGTRFVSQVTGAAYIVFGSSFVAGMLVFSSLAFWGGYFFLKLYRETFPERDLVAPALLLFFLPSTAFWTSSIGKDAAIFFFLGLFTWAFASLSHGFRGNTLLVLAIGLVGTARIRPHIALMLALAATTAIIVGMGLPRVPKRVSRVIGLGVLVVGILALLPIVQGYLRLEELSLAGTREFLEWQLRVTTKGGSAIATSDSLLVRLLTAPLTLVRPFPWEVHNLTSGIASAEGLLFAFLTLRYRRQIVHNLRTARTNLTLLFALVFIVEFLFAFSSIANFGILARQRVMLLPMLLCLFIAPKRVVAEDRRVVAEDRDDTRARPVADAGKAALGWSPRGHTG